MTEPHGSESRGDDHRTLRAMGVTILGVILSVGVTVGFGLTGAWWMRVLAGVASMVVLVVVVKLGTRQGARGPVTRAASWITGGDRPA